MTWFDIFTNKENISGQAISPRQTTLFGNPEYIDSRQFQTTNTNTTTKKTSQIYAPYYVNVTNSSGVTANPSQRFTDELAVIPSVSPSQTNTPTQTASSGGLNQLLLLAGVGVLGLAIFKGVLK
jgi:hypothetical protein